MDVLNIKFKFRFIFICTALVLFSSNSYGWGFFAHRKINKYAIFSLPPAMFKFYKFYADTIEERAVNPDKRRYIIKGEACKHFIDIESFIENYPTKTPNVNTNNKSILMLLSQDCKYWNRAKEKYTEKFLNDHGKLPWIIEKEKYKLINAFKSKDVERIIKISADIGHYIADANVPLHTTRNYDGQLTNQKGIHSFWETRIPKLFFNEYSLFIDKATYIADTQKHIWEAICHTHSLVKDVLEHDVRLTNMFPKNLKYVFRSRNGKMNKTISKDYCIKYQNMQQGSIEIQLKKSIKMVSDFWYTCWIEAGNPNLELLLKNSKIVIKETLKKQENNCANFKLKNNRCVDH